MAYKQSPGRQMMPKTGRGLSPALMCGSPMKQEFDLTLAYEKGKKKLQNQIGQVGTVEAFKKDGVIIDPKTNVAKAAPYEKRFLGGDAESDNKKVPTGKSTNARIVGGDGQLVKEANKNSLNGKILSNEKLYREYQRDSSNTMSSRNSNARLYNLSGGGKAPEKWDANDLKTMRNLGKATR